MSAVIHSLVWIDPLLIADKDKQTMFARLTVHSAFEPDAEPIKTWDEKNGLIGLPITYGFKVIDYLEIKSVDNRSLGKRVLYRKLPTPRNEKQSSFFTTLEQAARNNPAALAVAPTGTGKTVAALQTIAKLGRTAIVIVPSKSLAHQWKKEAMLHLGCESKDVHVFEGGKCKWESFKIVVAVIHNLCNRDWPEEFYSYFGTAIWDEAHRTGAVVFSQSIKRFPARYRIALTATPVRKDGRTAIITQTFGDPSDEVTGNDMKPLPCTAYVVNTSYPIKAPAWGDRKMQMGQLISSVANHKERNQLIANIVVKGYSCGRTVLVISDRIEQLKHLWQLLLALEVAKSEVGLFIGSTPKEEQERVKVESRIILATYGMMKEGQDIPRLDMGIDATPRSEGIQAIGRIRRTMTGKPHPIWITLFDAGGSGLLQGISGARIKDYKACGVEVINIDKNLNLIQFMK